MGTGRRLRGAVVGLGHMGRHHLRKLAARADVDVVGVDPLRGHPADVLADPTGLDFAVIATPTSTHVAVAEPLLRAGVACLVEKPLGADLAEARRLGVHGRLSVGHVERFNPALAPISAALDDVPPAFIEATRLSPWRAPQAGARGTDVDVVADLMLHDLDLVLHWLGDDSGRLAVRDVRAVGVGVLSGSADIVDARLELSGPRGDAVVVLRASRVSPAPVRTVRVFAPGRYW
ncbi:MAG: gfo/Idh/MocA family oxidoreductase, partial [Deltaproteobacteria bacterium]